MAATRWLRAVRRRSTRCGSPPAVLDLDDICPKCGEYNFLCGIATHVPLGDFPLIHQQVHKPRWERIPPSQVKPPAFEGGTKKARKKKPAKQNRGHGGRPRSAEVEEVQKYIYERWIKGDKLAAIKTGAEKEFGVNRAPAEEAHVTQAAKRYAAKHGLSTDRKLQ